MFLNLGYYPTESSGHNSEYNAWFRKRPDLIEKYCTHGTGWNPGVHAYILNGYLQQEEDWEKRFKEVLDAKEVDLKRGGEYASNIFNAIFGDHTPFEFNGNVPNDGLIDNLPPGACVEVPVLASKAGLRPFRVGPLPDQIALLVNTSSRCEELAITGAIEGNPEKVFQAILFDPLTASVLSMAEIREMTAELFKKNRDFLGYFKTIAL
jgi:alpha-galactosidase